MLFRSVDLDPLEKKGIITFSDTTTADSIFYQPRDFIGYSHIQGMYPYDSENWTEKSMLYFCSTFKRSTQGLFDYANKFNSNHSFKLTRSFGSQVSLALAEFPVRT